MNAAEMVRQTDASTQRRFNAYRKRSQERQGATELTYDEFLNQLLDVWKLHVRREGGARDGTEAIATDGGPGLTGGDEQ